MVRRNAFDETGTNFCNVGRSTMKYLTLPASRRARVMNFLRDFQAASNDADIEVRLGRLESGEASIAVSINDRFYGFTTKEARTLAQIMEDAMHANPNEPEAKTLPNIIMALRLGADKADSQQWATY
jgi:hypothetical protein